MEVETLSVKVLCIIELSFLYLLKIVFDFTFDVFDFTFDQVLGLNLLHLLDMILIIWSQEYNCLCEVL